MRISGILFALMMLTGCAAIIDRPTASPPRIQDGPGKPVYFLSGADVDQYFSFTSTQKRNYRDKYIVKGIISITENYHDFKYALSSEDKLSTIGLNLATLGLAGVQPFVDHIKTLQTLGAAIAGLAGAKSTIDERTLLTQTLSAIVAKMDAQRAKVTE